MKLDLTFAGVVAEQFDDYVHAEVLYYPVGAIGGLQMPPLTLGTWLETEWRLNALIAVEAERIGPPLAAARAVVRRARSRTLELYQAKSRREFKSRLDSWEMFLEDRGEDAARAGRGAAAKPYNDGPGFATQAHMRFKLELLKEDASQLTAQLSRLRLCDARLRARFRSGRFVWEPVLAPAAPADKYWWLYAA